MINYKTISSYSFENEGSFVKIYITCVPVDAPGFDGRRLKGVGTVPADSITKVFAERSFSVCVHNLEGQNYRLQVPKTSEEIEAAGCSVTVKPNMLIIKLKKVSCKAVRVASVMGCLGEEGLPLV